MRFTSHGGNPISPEDTRCYECGEIIEPDDSAVEVVRSGGLFHQSLGGVGRMENQHVLVHVECMSEEEEIA